MAPGSDIFSSNRTDRGGSASSSLLRVPLAVALVAERDTVADAIREVRSLADRFNVVRNVRWHVPSVPLAILTEVLIPAHDRRRPITVPLFVVRWIGRHPLFLPCYILHFKRHTIVVNVGRIAFELYALLSLSHVRIMV